MEITRIKTDLLCPNTGQIEGLPSNPREWTQTDIDRIQKSLKETPELFEMRPCLVYEQDGKYVILGGNLRYEGAKRNKEKDIPCIVVPKSTPISKLKEIVVKDNGSFGEWDYDQLANEWDDLPLEAWGVNMPYIVDDEVEKIKKEKKEEVLGRIPFSEILNEEHNYLVLYFDNTVDWLQAQTLFDLKPVKNWDTSRNGNSEDFTRVGVGRILKGAEALDKLINFTDEDKH